MNWQRLREYIDPVGAMYAQTKRERDAWREEAELLAGALRQHVSADHIALASYEAFKSGLASRERQAHDR